MTSPDVEQLQSENAQLRQQISLLQQQLIQAQKLSSVGSLASSITHEFNNILTTIINYARMGVRHRSGPTRDKAFDKILAAGQRASRITTGMLSYARSKGDRREPLPLDQIVRDVLVLVEKDLMMHRVRLETALAENAWAEVNANQLQQVLLNLVINARQAMAGGGVLMIGTGVDQAAGMAWLAIRDSGSGIPADKLPQIFEPYFTTKEADAQGQGGTGLGLALCKEVIESHQGRIRVESVVGKGTTFMLRFPLCTAPVFRQVDPATQKAG